jgi:transposase
MIKILNVGIDISLSKACCCLLSQEGEYLCRVFEVENNPSGFDRLKDKILEAVKGRNFVLVRIGFEASSMYGYHLAEYFKNATLSPEVKVYMINAKYIHRFKKAFPEKEKTDLVDAQFIAEYLRFGKLPVEYEPESLYLPLKRLIRYRYHLVKSIEREKKLFIANLFLKFPGWVQARPIKTLNKTAFDVLAEFSLDELIKMPLEELSLFVAKAGRNRSPNPDAIAYEIKKAARESYRIREELSSSVTFILASIHRNITALSKALKELNKAIQAQSGGPVNPLISIRGIGPVYAAGIVASIGDIKRFSCHDKLARYAGLVWKKRQTGKSESEETRIVKECDKYLRYYLVEAANSLRVHNEIFRSFYQKKYLEVNKHRHKRALVLTARKLVRLVFALLSKNQYYNQHKGLPVTPAKK